MNDFREKALYFQKKCEELEANDCYMESSNLSEDSFAGHFDKDFLAVNKQRAPSLSDHLDNMTKDFNKQKTLAESRKSKLKTLKERFSMLAEELSGRLQESEETSQHYQRAIERLQKDNIFLSEEIQKINELLKEKEHEVFNQREIIEELDSVKASKAAMMAEFKSLLAEKEKLTKTFSETSSKVLEHKSSITSKDSLIYDLQDRLRQALEQVKAMKNHEEMYKKQIATIENSQSHQFDAKAQTENIQLKQELASLATRENLLDGRVKELIKENEEILFEWQEKLRIAQENFAKEIKKRDDDMIRQIEEATNGLMKQRDQLASRLQCERRNSLMNFQRAMSIKESPLPGAKDVFKLRDDILQKDREIAKLTRSNKELKNCWKQTAKLLKAVSKELGNETLKIEEAVKDRICV
jgi:predicted  nucleic acid-binding Zn-ribbon protein